jgi:hypothetical protein
MAAKKRMAKFKQIVCLNDGRFNQTGVSFFDFGWLNGDFLKLDEL